MSSLDQDVKNALNALEKLIADEKPSTKEYFEILSRTLSAANLDNNPRPIDAVNLAGSSGKGGFNYEAMAVDMQIGGSSGPVLIVTGVAQGGRTPEFQMADHLNENSPEELERDLKGALIGYMGNFGEPTDKYRA